MIQGLEGDVSEWQWWLLLGASVVSLLIFAWDKIKNGKDD